jgi:hypothetical protein
MNLPQESITIFTIPKPFEGHIGMIQKNAIQSWKKIDPNAQILLFGNEAGIEQVAKELEVTHVPDIHRNSQGTPLVNGVFQEAQKIAKNRILMYINCDIILLSDFWIALHQVKLSSFDNFLMIGRRIDVDITETIDFKHANWESNIHELALTKGQVSAAICKDYFVYTKPLYAEIPPFAIGRGHWDNWIVYHAHQLNIPVIDATNQITAIHQNHNYAHFSANRGVAYLKGKEAKQNAKLAGGMHVVRGTATNWKLTSSGIQRKLFPSLSLFFDLPRFSKLVTELIFA